MEDVTGGKMQVESPRGKKRDAGHLDEPIALRRIQALDQDVVNKIAAGEIIVAPVHALKELLENAVDAGATSVEVVAKEGGLKLLQITDNGCGIDKEDLPILCERFTTSKLQKFDDLASIATYGFRGEALASISHIAHLTVTTKTESSDFAWRAHYDSGKLAPAKPGQSAEPKPIAGRQGTQLTVEDLFYNVPIRRRAFRSAADEYNKIVDLAGRYAIHCSGVAFSCRKQGDSTTSISIQATASTADRIRQIYGSAVANELIEFSTSDARWGFTSTGWASNANYSSIKKTTFLLFINHRCVDSTNMKKAIEQTYAAFLPKNAHPFVYLSLEIDPKRVDVNVHPTKREVNFLNEDEITQAICEHIRAKLAAVDTSRTFTTQTLLVTNQTPAANRTVGGGSGSGSGSGSAKRAATTPARPSENNLVRTDANLRKITSMLHSSTAATPGSHATANKGKGKANAAAAASAPPEPIRYETLPDREPVVCRLNSVRTLRAAVRDAAHHELTDLFASHTFVGLVDERRRLAAVQSGVRLFLVNYGRVCADFFYQVGLTDFGNFGVVRLTPPLDLRAVLAVAAQQEQANAARAAAAGGAGPVGFDVAEVVDAVAAQLIQSREMLLEYFSLEVTPAGELASLPLLVRGYAPPMVKLPQFLLRLGPRVDWTAETACFDSFLRELAAFYVPEQLAPEPLRAGGDGDEAGVNADEGEERADDADDDAAAAAAAAAELQARRAHVRWALEHVLFPAFKARLVATKSLAEGAVLEVANLKGLYRVFERC